MWMMLPAAEGPWQAGVIVKPTRDALPDVLPMAVPEVRGWLAPTPRPSAPIASQWAPAHSPLGEKAGVLRRPIEKPLASDS